MKTQLISIYRGWTTLDTMALLVTTFYIVYAVLGASNTPIGADEAKYYLVATEIYAGRIPWIDIHPGPGGNLFYMLHTLWIKIAGVGYESGRLLGIALTVAAVMAGYIFLRLYVNRCYIPLIWLLLYLFNPYIVFYSFLISHHSISNAFMIMGVIAAFVVWKQSQNMAISSATFVPVSIIALALVCGMAFGAMFSIRIHMALLIPVVAVFFVIVLPKRMIYRVLPVYALGLLAVMALNHTFFELLATNYQPTKNIQSAVEKAQPVTEKIQYLAEEAEPIVDKTQLVVSIQPLVEEAEPIVEKASPTREKAQLAVQLDRSDIESAVLRNIRAADAKATLSKLNIFAQITNPHILQPLVKTLLGYSASSLFLVNIVLFVVALFMFRHSQRDDKVLVLFLIFAGAVVFFPVFLFRYLLQASASYFYQSYFFLTMLALFGILGLLRHYTDNALKNSKPILVVLFILIVMQNFIFGTPRYWYENPTYAIFKRLGYVESDYANSLYNTKSAAALVNTMVGPNDIVLVGNHGITPYLQSRHVKGTEMNMSPDFFSDYAVSLAVENHLKGTSMGTNALEIDRMLLQGDIQYIVDRGFIHNDLFVRMKNVFCLKHEKFGYRIYAKCP